MDARELIELLDNSAKDAQERGIKSVAIERIREVHAIALRMVEEDAERVVREPEEARMARFKAHLDHWIDDARRTHEANLEMFRSVLSAGDQALKSCMLINGGASVALLAFAGNLIEHGNTQVLSGVSESLAWFVGGVLGGALAFGFRYFSQAAYGAHYDKTGGWFRVLCILSGIGSLVAFVGGGVAAYVAIRNVG